MGVHSFESSVLRPLWYKDLRKTAFERLLNDLVAGERSSRHPFGKAARRASEVAPPTTKRTKKVGPMALLQDLVEEGFFKETRTSGDILAKLEESGHHLKLSDITDQLQQLVQGKVLRRKREPRGKGGRKVWVYSSW